MTFCTKPLKNARRMADNPLRACTAWPNPTDSWRKAPRPAAFVCQPICCKEDIEMEKITPHPTAVKPAGPRDDDREVFSKATETPQTHRVVEMRIKLRSGAYRVDTRRLADKLLRRR